MPLEKRSRKGLRGGRGQAGLGLGRLPARTRSPRSPALRPAPASRPAIPARVWTSKLARPGSAPAELLVVKDIESQRGFLPRCRYTDSELRKSAGQCTRPPTIDPDHREDRPERPR